MVDFRNPEIRAEWTKRGDRLRIEAQNGRIIPIEQDIDPHDADAVETLIRALRETVPDLAEAVRKAIVAAVAERRRYKVVPFGEWGARPRQPYVIAKLLRRGDLFVLYGPPKSKKSFIALDLAARVATGAKLWGRYTTVPGPVIYCSNEGVEMLGPRITGWMSGSNVDRHGLAKSLFITDRVPRLLEPGHQADFVRAVRETCSSPSLVVLDTLSGARGSADENDAASMQALLDAAEDLRRDLGCAILMVHHSRRNATGYRGSGVIEASADVMARIDRTGRDARLSFEALKDTADPGSLTFEFESIDLGIDEHDPDGGSLTTLRVSSATASDADNTDPIGFDGCALNGRELAIIRFLAVTGEEGATLADLHRVVKQEAGIGTSDRTHRGDLRGLEARGFIERSGSTSRRRYSITEKADRWVRHANLPD